MDHVGLPGLVAINNSSADPGMQSACLITGLFIQPLAGPGTRHCLAPLSGLLLT